MTRRNVMQNLEKLGTVVKFAPIGNNRGEIPGKK